jgi:amino acid permease
MALAQAALPPARPPKNNDKQTNKQKTQAMSTALTLYSLVAVLGYAALGPEVPDDVLIGFEKVNFAPLWLAMLANAAVLLHMIAAVQTYLQPIFEWLEDWLLARAPKTAGKVRPVFLRIALRTPLIAAITAIAVVIPAFGAVTGLVGAATYWPTAVYYPLKTYSNAHVVSKRRALVFRAINCVLLLISLAAMVGAVNGLVETARASFTAFGGGV